MIKLTEKHRKTALAGNEKTQITLSLELKKYFNMTLLGTTTRKHFEAGGHQYTHNF